MANRHEEITAFARTTSEAVQFKAEVHSRRPLAGRTMRRSTAVNF